MKLLFNLVKLMVLLAIFYLIAAFLGKSSYRVERSAIIDAPQKLVYTQISIFKNWPNWSPWIEKDSTVKNTFEGPDGDPCSVMSWVGDKDLSGTGSLRLDQGNPPFEMSYVLQFKVPFEMESKGGFNLTEESDAQTKVVWYDQGDIPFLFRPMMMFMDMDKQIGPDFDRGLFKIDSVCEHLFLQMKKVMEQDTAQQMLSPAL